MSKNSVDVGIGAISFQVVFILKACGKLAKTLQDENAQFEQKLGGAENMKNLAHGPFASVIRLDAVRSYRYAG
jgi:hypothetical protein